MVDPNATSNLAALFEQRSQEIEARKRQATDSLEVVSTSTQEEIRYHVVEDNGKPSYIWEMRGRKLLRSLLPDSEDGKKILAETWENRAQKSSLTTSPKDASQDTVTTLLAAAQERAAVSGRVSPPDLVRGISDVAIQQTVLSRLAPQCVIETYEGKVQWLYSNDIRTMVLRRLNDEGRLTELLDGHLPATDRFGLMLRELLRRGDGVNLENLEREDLLALTAAMEATSDAGLPQPDPSQVQKLIGREEFLSDYDVLLERGFVGRQEELQKLQNFVEHQPAPPHGWTSLVLTGLGGSGKSTLLAQLARKLFKERLATVVILDFDRPGIDASDTYWLEHELCRQVGHQYPEIDELLRRRRSEERLHRQEYVDSVRQSSAEAYEESRSSRSIIWSVGEALSGLSANQRPFLLVLDTLEQIQEQDILARLFDWMYDIASALAPTPLKIIFAGRLYDSDLELLEKHSQVETVVVDELEPPDAEQLLIKNGIPEPTAQRLSTSDLLPRRPLELTLLAKIALDLDKTIDELEEEVREGGDSAKELFAGLVYRRVLRRLGDDTAEQLAYPGLVLRYVTAELIQHVLVPALELPGIEDAEANRALDKLASCKWLAYRKNGEVWHRADLRRSTLKAMIAAERESAERISKEAIKFFEKRPDDKDRAEAVYHRLMLLRDPADGDNLELGELSKAETYIGSNATDLPPVAATLLKFAVTGRVPAAEVECLPGRYLESAYGEAGKNLVASRQFGKALKLFERRYQAPPPPKSDKLEEWETETLFATVTWDLLKPPSVPRGWESGVPDRTTLFSVARRLYPAQFIAPEVVAAYPASKMLQEVTRFEKLIQYEIHGVESQEMLRQLGVSFLYCVAQGSISPEFRASVDRFITEVKSLREPPLAPVTARRLMLLERALSEGATPTEVTFSVKTMKLARAWFHSFRDYFSKELDQSNGLTRLLSDLQQLLEGEPSTGATVRKVLGAIDAMSKEEGKRRAVKIVVGPKEINSDGALKYFRGPDPEFRDPCRFALLEAFPDRSSRLKLGEIIASLLDLNADDLEPDSFVDALAAEPEHALEVYVELVDRAWSLGELMSQAERVTVSRKLGRVSSAYRHWDATVRAVIARAFV